MKKLFALLMVVSSLAFAEASFDQIEMLIQQKNYSAAEKGLEVVLQNHPNSAKALYAMAQAQAGLGNLEKAQRALDKATGLNPTLDFAPAGSVQSLREAITPQVKKIEAIEETHYVRNGLLALIFIGCAYGIWVLYTRKRESDEGDGYAKPTGTPYTPTPSSPSPVAATKTTASVNTTSTASKTAEIKVDAPRKVEEAPRYTAPAPTYTPAPVYSAPAPSHTTVVNNTSNDGLLTGMILGNMMSNHHHDREVIHEREVVREVPTYTTRSSSWDDDSSSSSSSSSSRSSSWDDDSSSSSSSSSWSDSSSSSSSWSDSSSSSSSWDSSSSSSSDW